VKLRLLMLVLAVLALFTAFSVSSYYAQGAKKMDMRDAFVQEGSPIQLVGVTHSVDFLLSKAEVLNTSDRTVTSVTFGTVLREKTAVPSEPIFLSSREIPTNIKPGETRTLMILDVTTKDVQRKAATFRSNAVVVESGVLRVEFADGGYWEYDLKKTGDFGPISALAPSALLPSSRGILRRDCNPKSASGKFFAAIIDKLLPSVFAQSVWTCVSTSAAITCSVDVVDGQTCHSKICTHSQVVNHTCQFQQCHLE
jgi:hypothetical protein